ncbi:hypothetical protein LC613_10075 [Nostoc sphaeroides CHAB 2801]|uniref:hypothetical protein n=1 Tax=Nostoc sphaeroides TaxID=446679 RepID=UPI0015F2EDEE|nr:hypothetical protein [Nostoc sphaeroides]MCC5628438.1 hypothetical protein [Nostoc sphaeroides CHAB 2801]
MSLIHLLDRQVQMQLVIEPSMPNIPDSFSEVFFYNPSKELRYDIEKKYKLFKVFQHSRLWRLEQKSS